jgi:hypothetical protein
MRHRRYLQLLDQTIANVTLPYMQGRFSSITAV